MGEGLIDERGGRKEEGERREEEEGRIVQGLGMRVNR